MMEDDQVKWAVMHRRMKTMEDVVLKMLEVQHQRDAAKKSLLQQAVQTLTELDPSSLEIAKSQLVRHAISLVSEVENAEPPATALLLRQVFRLDQLQAEWDVLFGSMTAGGEED